MSNKNNRPKRLLARPVSQAGKPQIVTVLGYCALCRAKELELYGTIVNESGERHNRACLEAGCGHPSEYRFPRPI
jgi:hypothetical protein